MKKIKKIMMTLVAFVLVVAGMTPFVGAREVNNVEVLNKISEAQKSIPSSKGDFKSTVLIEVNGEKFADLKMDGNYMLNTEKPYSGTTNIHVTGETSNPSAQPASSEESQEAVQPEKIDEKVTATLVENILYVFDGTEWSSEDITEQINEFIKDYEENMATGEQAKALNEKTANYYDITETDSEYVVTLKKDIDPEAFWKDVDEVMDLQAMKDQTIEQAKKEAEANGQEFTEEQAKQMDYYFNNTLKFILQIVEQSEIHYNKENYQLTKALITLKVDDEAVSTLTGMDSEAMGMSVNGNITFELNAGNHGEKFEIEVPKDAPAPEENKTETDDETSEAAPADSSVEETAAETSAE